MICLVTSRRRLPGGDLAAQLRAAVTWGSI
jgi:hypothetical protein